MKTCELVSIGTELLSGWTVDCNAPYIAQEMERLGYTITAVHILPDEPTQLKLRLRYILDHCPLVIATGGLGPTCDDSTKQVAAEIFDSGMCFNDDIAFNLKERYGADLTSLQNQATVPSRAIVLPNRIGTAPALIFEACTTKLILLPGVPNEMQDLFQQQVLPYLQKIDSSNVPLQSKELLLPLTKEQDVDPFLRQIHKQYPGLQTSIYPRPGAQIVRITAPGMTLKEAEPLLKSALKILFAQFPDKAIHVSQGKIERAIHQLFITKRLSLSLAESCTGGNVASRLCAIPGASEYFLGGIVSYANEVKIHTLGVNADTLHNFGAVSKEVAKQMALGIRCLTGSTYGLSFTGIAGPAGGTQAKPVGTVWVGLADNTGHSQAWQLQLRGGRAKVIESAGTVALCQLWHTVQ